MTIKLPSQQSQGCHYTYQERYVILSHDVLFMLDWNARDSEYDSLF